MSGMDDVIKEFLVESYENLDQLDQEFVSLEQDPMDLATLGSIFRTIHTIKGTCGFLGFTVLESVTHVGESLLSLLRDGKLAITPEIITALLAMVDAVRTILSNIESSGAEGGEDYVALIATLIRLQEDKDDVSRSKEVLSETDARELASPTSLDGGIDMASKHGDFERPQPDLGAQMGVNTESFEVQPMQNEHDEADPVSEVVTQQIGSGRPLSENTIRVDVELLDALMNLVGELVLTRNQILQYTTGQEDTVFVATGQRLNLITTELQESVMKTRMQPIGNVWNKLPRVVRDLAQSCHKQIRIEMEGKDTDLDKTLIEAIKDPLTHVVRNAVDHGIEPPELRAAKGKPLEGCLLLRAFHEGGQVNIEISDDGAGIDPQAVKNKALQRGLITRDQAANMNEREIVQLIFTPGFSTADKVTNVSGRGVGMDVVKTNIEKIGGSLDIQSMRGIGTTLKIKIPLTLAIIPALIVTSAGARYAIPQVSLLELVRLEGGQARMGIEVIQGAPVYRLRGNLLPLVDLNQQLEVSKVPVQTRVDHDDTAEVNIVVLQADDRQFGLVVDEINDTEEIVVKPLSKQFKGLTVFAGATIMGDGKVALILDVPGMAQKSHVIREERDRTVGEQGLKTQEGRDDHQLLLLVGLGEDGRIAIPLSMVARLEELPRHSVEKAGGGEVVQYRGQILPLAFLSNVLHTYSHAQTDEEEPLQVVVYMEDGRSMGLVVDRILDVVEDSLGTRHDPGSQGVLGSAVIQGRVTDLLDVHEVIRSIDPNFFERPVAAAVGA